MKLEVEVIPVSDVDRSKEFYERLGWRLDDDVAPMDGLRIVQFTPPGSGTSVTSAWDSRRPRPARPRAGLIVSDIEAAHDELVGRGIDVSDIWHGPPFPVEARQPGPDPERTSYGSFFSFTDPDGNTVAGPGGHDSAPRPDRTPLRRATYPPPTWRRASACRGRTRRAREATGRRTCSRSSQDETGPPGTPPTWWREQAGRDCRMTNTRPRPLSQRPRKERHASHHRRHREQRPDRDPLRGPRQRPARSC